MEVSLILDKGKYHFTAGRLLDWFGFNHSSYKSVDNFNITKLLNPNQ